MVLETTFILATRNGYGILLVLSCFYDIANLQYPREAETIGLENAEVDNVGADCGGGKMEILCRGRNCRTGKCSTGKILNVICRQFLSFIAGSSATFPCSYLLKQCSVAIASHTHTHTHLMALCPGLPG